MHGRNKIKKLLDPQTHPTPKQLNLTQETKTKIVRNDTHVVPEAVNEKMLIFSTLMYSVFFLKLHLLHDDVSGNVSRLDYVCV